jgi:hypothetical protein
MEGRIGIPLALDSWWDLALLLPGVAGRVRRILDDEQFRTQE